MKTKKLGAWTEEEQLEYFIRRYQNAIVVLKRSSRPKDEREQLRVDILWHAHAIIPLKLRLLELTGRCSPRSPKWPN